MYTFQAFGGVRLADESGPLKGAATQRRRLAVLALLASAPTGSVSRDKLIGLLWPDLDTEAGRSRLADALHGLRRVLGRDAVLSSGDEVRLNPSSVRADVAEFSTALAAGDCARAVALYRGPFLDGFFVTGASEFERWLEDERQRLAGEYARALETLAVESEATGDPHAAADWLRRLAAHEPYSSRVSLQLMRVLVADGDTGAALLHAQSHAERLRQDLAVDTPPEIARYVHELRRAGSQADLVAFSSPGPRRPLHDSAEPPSGRAHDAGYQGTTTYQTARQGATERRLRRWPGVPLAIVGTLAAIMITAVLLPRPGRDRPVRDLSAPLLTAIAVLPFENLTGGTEDTYFAAGLHDEVVTYLASVPSVTVISRTSVLSYAGTGTPLRQIAMDLGVGSIVVGSVQVDGDRLRVHIQLVDAASGAQIWAERYDRALDDAFAVQSDIAQRIVTAVGARLTSGEGGMLPVAPTAHAEAYRFYLQARDYHLRSTLLRQDLEVAQQLYQRAIELDADFALARAAQSEVHGLMYQIRFDPTPQRVAQQRAEAEVALRIAPGLPQAHMAMGLVRYWGDQDFTGALAHFDSALAGLPNDAKLWGYIGFVQRRLGNWEAVLAALENATRLDPRDTRLLFDLGGNSMAALRRHREAVHLYERALSLTPDLHGAAIQRARTFTRWEGHLDTLRATLDRMPVNARLGPLGSVGAQRMQLLHWERQADSLLLASATSPPLVEWQDGLVPAAMFEAWAHQLRDDEQAARVAFLSALRLLDALAEERPDDWRVHAGRGLALAGLGRRDEALREARWLEQSSTYRHDEYFGRIVGIDRARILAQLGDVTAALAEIERLLGAPSLFAGALLRLDPLFDPIRHDLRIRALQDTG